MTYFWITDRYLVLIQFGWPPIKIVDMVKLANLIEEEV